MTILALSQVSKRGTAHIPKKVQEKLGLHNGDSVLWIEEGDKVYIKKA